MPSAVVLARTAAVYAVTRCCPSRRLASSTAAVLCACSPRWCRRKRAKRARDSRTRALPARSSGRTSRVLACLVLFPLLASAARSMFATRLASPVLAASAYSSRSACSSAALSAAACALALACSVLALARSWSSVASRSARVAVLPASTAFRSAMVWPCMRRRTMMYWWWALGSMALHT